jgi:hypothetical protein
MLDWITPESWAAFLEMRRRIKAPLTPYAEKLIMRELVKLKTAGNDPQACLDQSIMLGWRDVFPLREKGLSKAPAHEAFKPEPKMTEAEKAASDQARQMAMRAIKRVQT